MHGYRDRVRKQPDRIYEGRKPQPLGARTGRKNLTGPQLRQARLERQPQWSLEELSQALLRTANIELSESALSKIENGQRSVYDYELQAFAMTLDVSLDWLVNGEHLP
ncbi:hypothetical protein GCM10010842_40480 [Deinococcus daejeonensis]|uniref:HTH cro/C1-type domain-containing protein n=1 Tax=Deinococcus daejeonensis TaxID=1007098 RepID=A0ABQ2JMQ9_9DEIO|nr:hypothetical protein GCM10010842_40480 [Deinococcus daejeonensis]